MFGSLSPLTVLTNFTLCIKTVKHTLGKLSVALVMKCVRVTAWCKAVNYIALSSVAFGLKACSREHR